MALRFLTGATHWGVQARAVALFTCLLLLAPFPIDAQGRPARPLPSPPPPRPEPVLTVPSMLWALPFSGYDGDVGIDSGAPNANAMGVAVDPVTAEVLACGSFNSRFALLGVPTQPNATMFMPRTANVVGDDGYIVKVGASGTVQWASHAGGNGTMGAYSVSVDGSSNVAAGGTFANLVSFTRMAPGGLTVPSSAVLNTSLANGQDAWVAQLTSQGFLTWAYQVGGAGLDAVVAVGALPVANGNIYALGYLADSGPSVFGVASTTGRGWMSSNSVTLPSTPFSSFLMLLSSSGMLQWQTMFGGSDPTQPLDSPYGLAVDPSGATTDAVAVGGCARAAWPCSALSG